MAIVDPYIYYYVSCCYEVDVLYLYKRFLFHCIVPKNKKYDKIYEPPILEVSVQPLIITHQPQKDYCKINL